MRASLYLFVAIAILAVVVSGEDAEDAGGQPGAPELVVSTELDDMDTTCLFQQCTLSFLQEGPKERGGGWGKFAKKMVKTYVKSAAKGGGNEE